LSIFDWQPGIKMSVAEVARIREKAPSKPYHAPQRFSSTGGEIASGFGEISTLKIIY